MGNPRINNVTISGRMCADAELRYLESGAGVAKFTIAVDHSYKKGDDWVQETSFVNMVTWKNLAEKVAEKGGKGASVICEGQLKIRDYVDKDNNKRKSTEITCHRVHILDSSNNNEQHKESEWAMPPAGINDTDDNSVPF